MPAASADLKVLVPPMPAVYGILPVDEGRDRDDGDQHDSVTCQKISEGEAEESVRVELVGVKRKDDYDQQERQQACQHLPLRVAPVGLSFLALHHCSCPPNRLRVPLEIRP